MKRSTIPRTVIKCVFLPKPVRPERRHEVPKSKGERREKALAQNRKKKNSSRHFSIIPEKPTPNFLYPPQIPLTYGAKGSYKRLHFLGPNP
jgi:hypothetical protein